MPPPTEPEHAPIKARTNIKNPIDPPSPERGSRVYPVVVTMEIDWKKPYLIESFTLKPSFI